MNTTPTTANPLYRCYRAVCPEGRAGDFGAWARGMARTYCALAGIDEVTDSELIHWIDQDHARRKGAA